MEGCGGTVALVNRLHHPVTALGPGARAGIWLQGCSIGCKGCASADTWPADAGRAVPVEALIAWIGELAEAGVDGVTITGGEPFDQPEALAALLEGIEAVRAEQDAALDVLCFSGRTLRHLEANHPELLARCDAVIAGPYVRTRPTKRIWCGSDNQRLVPMTELGGRRYAAYVDREVERPPLQVNVDDGVWIIGVPRPGDLERLERRLADAGVTLEGASWRAT